MTASNLTGTGNSFGGQLLHVRHTVSAGTGGGFPSTSSFSALVLNTTVTNEISSATVVSNVISLPAGTYFVEASHVHYRTDDFYIRLYNTSDSAVLVAGVKGWTNSSAGYDQSIASLKGRFTLAGTKNIEFQHFAQSGAGTGSALGVPRTSSVTLDEIFGEIFIWKVG